MGYFLFVPTIDTGKLKISADNFKILEKETGIDVATLRNALYGSGIDCLKAHSDPAAIEKIAEVLTFHKIPYLFTQTEELLKIPVYNAKKLIAHPDRIEFLTDSRQKLSIFLQQPIAIASDTKWSRDSIQRSVMKGEQFVIASPEHAFVFRAKSVIVENVPGTTNYSRTHNTALFLEYLFKSGNELYVDSSFRQLQGVLRGGFPRYAAFLSQMLITGFLKEDFPENLLEEVTEEDKPPQPTYNYRKYTGLKLYLHRYLRGIKAITVDHTAVAWVLFIFLAYGGVRTGSIGAIALGAGILSVSLTTRFFQLMKLKNLIQDIPISKLRSVSAGFVEVLGRIHAQSPLISPISGAKCAYFRYIKEKRVNTRDGYNWNATEIGEAIADDCFLDDGTGIISLNLKNARFSISAREKSYNTYADLNMGIMPASGISNVRYTEEYLEDGKTVYAMGTATPVNPLRRFGEYLSYIKKDKNRLLRFDLDGNGVVDEAEWQLALPQLRREFLDHYMKKGQSFSLMIDYRKDFPIFLVSDQPEEKLLKTLKWKIPVTLVMGLVSFVIFLILLVSIIGG
ncbi:MAG: hypothetical protein GXO70_10090 [Acidobacteria bacterium]|nr:hypothetical protein [Acidobacteriota bacterium]